MATRKPVRDAGGSGKGVADGAGARWERNSCQTKSASGMVGRETEVNNELYSETRHLSLMSQLLVPSLPR